MRPLTTDQAISQRSSSPIPLKPILSFVQPARYAKENAKTTTQTKYITGQSKKTAQTVPSDTNA
jgi:hypothetical protein